MKKILMALVVLVAAGGGGGWALDTYYDPYWPPRNEVIISTFSDTSEWRWISPFNGKVAYDSNKSHGVIGRGISLKDSSTLRVTIQKYDRTLCDMPDSCPLRISAYAWIGTSHYDLIDINLYHDSALTKYFSKTSIFKQNAELNRKIETCIYKSEFNNVGSAVWDSIKFIRIMLRAKTGDSMKLTLNKMSYAPNAGGIVSISFDDGRISQFTNAYPILTTKGIKATFYVIPSRIDSSDDYMTTANLDSLNANGHDVSSHTFSHLQLDTVTSSTMLEGQIRYAYSWLKNRGYAGARFFAYPWGAYSVPAAKIVNRYHNAARTIRTTLDVNDVSLGETNPPAMRWNIVSCADRAKTTDSVLMAIDSCIAKRGIAQLVFHTVFADSSEYAPISDYYKNQGFSNYVWAAKFEEIIDSILVRQTAGKCTIKNMSQMYRKYEVQ
jgi:peptidoglycan/xylan/chitin deacetylase (PgdA/CDA1 family)